MLKRLEELLSNRFQSKKTAFQRQEEESEQLKEIREKAEEGLRQEKYETELIEEVSDLFAERVCDPSMDSKLREAILKDQRKIKREIVKCTMEYHFPLEQVLGAIMEEIKFNEERVVREGAVSDELIEVGIRNFLTINEIVEEMVEKVVIEVDNSTVLQNMQEEQRKRAIDLMYSSAQMQAPSSVFNNVTNEPIAGPSCRR